MKSDLKNITYPDGSTAKVGDLVIVTEKHKDGDKKHPAILVAVNAEQSADNGRVVHERALHALPVVTIANLQLVEQAATKPVAVSSESNPIVPPDGLKQDGPTYREFIAAGGKPEDYPPEGYAERLDAEEIAAAKKGVEKFRRKV